MAYYAKIENDIVTNIIVADKEFIDSGVVEGEYLECTPRASGGKIYDDLGKEILNAIPLRHNYPDIGSTYNRQFDVFYAPHPNDGTTWIVNTESFTWERPIPYPNNDGMYVWDEKTFSWIKDPYSIPVAIF